MTRRSSPFVLATLVLCGSASLSGQSAVQAAIRINVVANAAPPSLVFSWPADATATSYQVQRRLAGAASWSPATMIPGGAAATSWTDAGVAVGARYEYRFVKFGTVYGSGYVTAGVEAAALHDRGAVVLLVDDTMVAPLASRLDRLVDDLTGDGYRVVRHDVSPTESVPNVKALIVADSVAYNDLSTVFVLGHVPVPYSGNQAPDGHGNHVGAWPADMFYGELDGLWTDVTVNNASASRPQNHNVPGDGKYDQSSAPGAVELGVGRVDFHDMPLFASTEAQLLMDYLDKDHDYRHKVFTVAQQAIVDDHFGYFGGEAFAANGWRNLSALCGTANVTAADYFTTLNTAAGPGYAWSYACGGGTYTSANGVGNTAQFAASSNRCVFTMLFGSYFGDWDSTNNFLRAPLAQGWTLTNAWAGRPNWTFDAMGLGQSIGYCTRYSQNNTAVGGYFGRGVHMALMGDPTLRQHVVAPPSSVALVDNWPQIDLSWTPSSDPVAGYHVYRRVGANAAFQRLTTAAVPGTSWSDLAPAGGDVTYMVRAERLEATPTGSYWNLSQGAFAGALLPSQAAAHTGYGAGCDQLMLSASPPPVSTPSAGTLVTYSIDNIPEAAPQSGIYFGVTIISATPDLTGTSLASLGMTGCFLHVGGLDLTKAFVGASATQTVDVQVPPGLPPGTAFYAQAAALTMPGLLNAFGASTSNGVASLVNGF